MERHNDIRGAEEMAHRAYKDAEEHAESIGRNLLTIIRNHGLASREAHARYHEYLAALDTYKAASAAWHRAHDIMTKKGLRSWR